MRPLALRVPLLALLVAGLAHAIAPALAAAQDRTAGEVSFEGMVATQPTRVTVIDRTTTPVTMRRVVSTDFGGAMVADLWANFGPLRIGGTMGVAPVTSADATRSRVILPLGASVAVSLATPGGFALDLRLRGGFWAGATNFGIAADAWGSLGLWIGYALGGRATAYLGVDVWVVRAQTSQSETTPDKTYDVLFFVAPGLSISWLP